MFVGSEGTRGWSETHSKNPATGTEKVARYFPDTFKIPLLTIIKIGPQNLMCAQLGNDFSAAGYAHLPPEHPQGLVR